MLELKAALLALQAFLTQLKQQHRQFGIDNNTAVIYINKLVGTCSHHLTSLALEMWNFVADRDLTLSSVYVPGEGNHIPGKVKGVPGQPGMDATSSSVSGIAKRSWLFRYRSLCNTCEPSVSCICQLEIRSWGSCHRCFQCKMEFSTVLPIPSLLYDQQMSQKN